MRLGVTGTGSHSLTFNQSSRFVACLFELTPGEIHTGDCIFADEEMADLAVKVCEWKIRFVLHPPIDAKKRAFWRPKGTLQPPEYRLETRLGRPYLDRNHDIVDATDLLIACPGEAHEVLRSGTWATVRYARKKGKPIWIISPDGNLRKENV